MTEDWFNLITIRYSNVHDLRVYTSFLGVQSFHIFKIYNVKHFINTQLQQHSIFNKRRKSKLFSKNYFCVGMTNESPSVLESYNEFK